MNIGSYRNLVAILMVALMNLSVVATQVVGDPVGPSAMVGVGEQTAPADCAGCGDADCTPPSAACDALCGVAAAILPGGSVLKASARGRMVARAGPLVAGRIIAPILNPPKFAVLS